MPELPEVESVRLSLLSLKNLKVERLNFSKLAPVETTSPQKIKRAFLNSTLAELRRWGKYLILENNHGAQLVLHLGMSGQLRLVSQNSPDQNVPTSHRHLECQLSDGSQLIFIDPRRFGTISLSLQKDGLDNSFLKRLGPDFLADDFNAKLFVQRSQKHPKINLKTLLLHQGVAAGLGNIYACEALYRAKLDPRRLVQSTSDRELKELWQHSREVLQEAIEQGGTSLRDYLNGLGQQGVMKQFLRVYGREGENALDADFAVCRIVQQGRSTFFCPELQK